MTTLPSVVAELEDGEDVIDYVREHLTLSRGGEGQAKAAHVLNISLEHPHQGDAARILEAVIDSYRQFVDETFQNVGSEAVTLIAQASENLADDLNQKQAALLKHREAAPLLWNNEDTQNVHQTRIDQFETELAVIGVRKARLDARLKIIQDRLKSSDAGSLTDISRLTLISEEDIQRLSMLTEVERGSSLTESFQATQPARSQIATVKYDRLLTLKMEARALQEEFGPNHAPLRDKLREIDELDKLVQQSEQQLDGGPERPPLEGTELLEAYVALLTQDLSELERREQTLKELVKREVASAKEFVRFELEDQALREEIAGSTDLRNTVINRLKEVNFVRDYGGFVTEVLSPVEAGKPQKTALPLVLAVGSLLGCVLGTALAMLIDVTDRSFRGPEEIRRVLDLPVLAHVPKVRLASGWLGRRKSKGLPVAPAVWSALRPRSRDAEVFRSLRADLCFGAEGERRKVIQITSPSPGDGKSVVAANLATSLAQSCHNVLLVDCDLRRPRQHELFQIDRREGLSTVLTGATELPDAVQPTTVDGLSVITCGPLPSNPAELLSSPRFADFLELASSKYDFVLLDSAPLLSVSDPATIAARADGVLLVLRLTKDARSLATGAMEKLEAVHAHTFGVVVNCVDRKSLKFYGERGRDPVEFGGRRNRRHDDYFVDSEQPVPPAHPLVAAHE